VLTYNRETVLRTLQVFGAGEAVEIRVLNAFGSKSRTDAGYWTNYEQAASAVGQYANHPRNSGIYFVLNPFNAAVTARALNRFAERIDATVNDADVTRRRWFFVDCDPVRPAGISSSEAEWKAAQLTAAEVAKYLVSQGWPAPVVCCSGNGWHLHWMTDAENDEETKTTIRNALRALAAKFSTAAVTIDTKVFNAARVCKLYGTVARKGDSTPDRPHRVATLHRVPDEIKLVAWQKVQALAADAPADATAPKAEKRPRPRKSVVDRAAKYLEKVPPAVSGESGHDKTFHAACVLVLDFGLPIPDALELLETWNQRCEPPWTTAELLHKLEDADKVAGERGRLLRDDKYTPPIRQPHQPAPTLASQPAAEALEAEDDDPENSPDWLRYYQAVLAKCGITHVSQQDGGAVEIFSECTQRFTTIRDVGALKYEALIQAGGHKVIRHVRGTSADAGDYALTEIRTAIAAVASNNTTEDEKRGVGIWEHHGSLVVCTSKRLGILNGTPMLQVSNNPVFCGEAFNVGDRCNWIDLRRTQAAIGSVNAEPGRLYVDEVFQLHNVFSKFNYGHAAHAWPEVLTGLVLATWTQTLWKWRPQVFLIGQAYSGKTTLLKALAQVFGRLCKMSSNSSAAGIRQYIGASGRIAICDELEKAADRPRILEMVRASGRGDESFRGTASQHSHIAFRLQHIFWCAAIESGLVGEADTSRFIVCELSRSGKIELPSYEELAALGQKLMAVALLSVRPARRLVEHLMDNRPQNVHGRVCESYAVPVAMYATSVGMPDSDALALFVAALGAIPETDQVQSDSAELIEAIATAQVRLPGGRTAPVSSLIESAFADTEASEALLACGLQVTPEVVMIQKSAVLRYLLPNEWRGKRIDIILRRIPGVTGKLIRAGKSVNRWTIVPRIEFKPFSHQPEEIEQAKQADGADLADFRPF
jgi:hypothetical protein